MPMPQSRTVNARLGHPRWRTMPIPWLACCRTARVQTSIGELGARRGQRHVPLGTRPCMRAMLGGRCTGKRARASRAIASCVVGVRSKGSPTRSEVGDARGACKTEQVGACAAHTLASPGIFSPRERHRHTGGPTPPSSATPAPSTAVHIYSGQSQHNSHVTGSDRRRARV